MTLIRKRVNYDLTVLGISCVKTSWNRSEGIVSRLCRSSKYLVYSY